MVAVNDAPVNDGTRGCDRAALIFQCTIDKSPDVSIFYLIKHIIKVIRVFKYK